MLFRSIVGILGHLGGRIDRHHREKLRDLLFAVKRRLKVFPFAVAQRLTLLGGQSRLIVGQSEKYRTSLG